jgi:hypothetical protein
MEFLGKTEKTMDNAMICSTEHKEAWLAIVL